MNDEEILNELKDYVAFNYSYDIALKIICPSDEYADWIKQAETEFIGLRLAIYFFIIKTW